MADLFADLVALEPLPLKNADVSYQRELNLGLPPDLIMKELIKETPWRQEAVSIWGRTVPQPRLVAWYGDAGYVYHYSGITLEPLHWTHRITRLKERVEAATGHIFNTVLLNFYRNQNDSMGLHSDDEKELGPRPVIASLSLGAERIFVFKNKRDPEAKSLRVALASGSLLLMKGDTQTNYKHGIIKTANPQGPRINLTFRKILGKTTKSSK